MKAIKRSKKKLPLGLKLILFLVILAGLISFLLSVKFKHDEITSPVPALNDQLAAPLCSAKSGFYKTFFSVELASSSGTLIYYTTDGSIPGLMSEIYTSPIAINASTAESASLALIPTSPRWKSPIGNVYKGTLIRAIAVKNNKRSKETSCTYWVDQKGEHKYSLPIMELTVDPEDLFDYKKGIYVLGKDYEDKDRYIRKKIPLNLRWWEYPSNYLQRGPNSERIAHVEYFPGNNNSGFAAEAGIRINGNATRGYPQKSLRINFKGENGIKYKLFPDYDLNVFHSLILRNGGNDWNKTIFRDALIQHLMRNSFVDIQQWQPIILFINGEYWGIHEIRERQDENYISGKYTLNKDSISILENDGAVLWGKKKDTENFRELLFFIRTSDLIKKENYDIVCRKIDVLNFIDYVIANVYFCNSDWPNNNLKFWRYKKDTLVNNVNAPDDGRWRWMLFDTDWGFGYTGNESYQLNLLKRAENTGSLGVIFGGLLKNKEFRELFKKRFESVIATIFNDQNVENEIEKFKKILSPEITEHINRWRSMSGYTEWEKNVEELKEFQHKRRPVQIQQLEEFLKSYK